MQKVATNIVKDCGLSDSADMLPAMVILLNTLIINVCSLANIVVLLYDGDELTEDHLKSMKMYISDKCDSRKMHGGTSMASDYFGYEHPSYSSHAGRNELAVDFDAQIARPAIQGGGHLLKKKYLTKSHEVREEIYKHIRIHNPKVYVKFVDIMNAKLSCLVNDICHTKKKNHGTFTIKHLQKILTKDEYFVFK